MTTPKKPSHIYGAGQYYGISNNPNPTPTTFDTMQDMTLSYKRTVESLWGRKQFPDDIRGGPVSLTGKVSTGSLNGREWGDLLIGASTTNYMDHIAPGELKKVGNNAKVTVNNFGASVYQRNLGVFDPATNMPLIRVLNAGAITTTMLYTVDAVGTYQFHSSRAQQVLAFTYVWQEKNPQYGTKIYMVNQEQGQVGEYTSVMSYDWDVEQNVFTLFSCMTTDAEIGAKQGKHSNPTHSFTCGADAFGNVGVLNFAQKR